MKQVNDVAVVGFEQKNFSFDEEKILKNPKLAAVWAHKDDDNPQTKRDSFRIPFTKTVYEVGDTVEVTEDNRKAVNQGPDLKARGKAVVTFKKAYGTGTVATADGGTTEADY